MSTPSPASRYTAARTSLRTAAIMVVFTVAFTAIMAFTYSSTLPSIEASMRDEQLRLINEVLPPGSYDNILLDDVVHLGRVPALGPDSDLRAWRARRAGEPVAIVVEAVAPDGYSGRIGLIVAVGADGRVSGVRVTSHKETPGLGDYIDPKKDRNKHTPWIAQFFGASWHGTPWAVKKDGGAFDYRVGATISARAVTAAVGRVAAFVAERREALYAAAPGGALQESKP